MEKRTVGDANLSVSRVALGTMTFGSQVDEAAAAAMIDDCLNRGINYIDTANVYNAGTAEPILGSVLKVGDAQTQRAETKAWSSDVNSR